MKILKYLSKIPCTVIAMIAAACVFAFVGCADGNDGKTGQAASGEFYTLQEAYDENLISLEDLKNIAYGHNGGKNYNEEIMSDFMPAENAALSDETQTSIKESHAKYLRETKRPDGTSLVPDATAEYVKIYGYYGTYNGCVAVMIEDDYTSYDCAMWMVTVEGIKIYYNSGNRITVWKQT